MTTLTGIAQIRPRDLTVELAKEAEVALALRGDRPLVSYIGWTGQGNLGDEILLEAHHRLLPDLRVVPYTRLGLAERLPGARATYRGGFLGGGTLINQSITWLRRMTDLVNRGRPVACLGSGVTPPQYQHDFERTDMAEWVPVLRRLAFLGVRGPQSQQALAEVGIEVEITGDPALALAPEEAPRAIAQPGTVGVNLGVSGKTLMFGDPERFLTEAIGFVRGLVADGHRVRLLPVTPDDLTSNERVLAEVDHPGCTLERRWQTYETYAEAAGECEVFVGQKLHATVIAVTQRVPSLMVSYLPKCEDFMASIGQSDHSLRTDAFTAGRARERVTALLGDADSVRAHLDDRVLAFRTRQHHLGRELTTLFVEGRP